MKNISKAKLKSLESTIINYFNKEENINLKRDNFFLEKDNFSIEVIKHGNDIVIFSGSSPSEIGMDDTYHFIVDEDLKGYRELKESDKYYANAAGIAEHPDSQVLFNGRTKWLNLSNPLSDIERKELELKVVDEAISLLESPDEIKAIDDGYNIDFNEAVQEFSLPKGIGIWNIDDDGIAVTVKDFPEGFDEENDIEDDIHEVSGKKEINQTIGKTFIWVKPRTMDEFISLSSISDHKERTDLVNSFKEEKQELVAEIKVMKAIKSINNKYEAKVITNLTGEEVTPALIKEHRKSMESSIFMDWTSGFDHEAIQMTMNRSNVLKEAMITKETYNQASLELEGVVDYTNEDVATIDNYIDTYLVIDQTIVNNRARGKRERHAFKKSETLNAAREGINKSSSQSKAKVQTP